MGYTGYTGFRGYREYSGYSRLKGLGVDINSAGDTETGIQGDNGIQRNTGGCKQRRIQSKHGIQVISIGYRGMIQCKNTVTPRLWAMPVHL